MRVLRVYHSGVVTQWRARDRALRSSGVAVSLVTARRWNEGGAPITFDAGEDSFVSAARTVGKRPNLFVYDPRTLWRLLAAGPYDLIDIHEEACSLAMAEMLALRALRAPRVPFVFYSAQNIRKRYPPPFRWIERICLRSAAGAYTCNRAASRILKDKGLRGPAPTIPLGVDIAQFSPADRRPPEGPSISVGFVGRLEPHKGVEVLLEAMRQLDSVKAVVAGDGPDSAALERRAHELGLADRISFVGYLPQQELPDFYRSLDAIVIPSIPRPGWDEQFCRVAVEAMASGTPVVASATGALPEVVGTGGLLFAPADPSALAASLRSIAEPGRWSTLRRAALDSAARFGWETVADSQRSLYEIVTGRADPCIEAPAPSSPVVVLVVAYGPAAQLAQALAALGHGHPVVVVDNSRSQETRAVCEAAGAHYIEPSRNVGFAAGVNLGLAAIQSHHGDRWPDVLLLNPDASISSTQVDVLQSRLRADTVTAAIAPSLVNPESDAHQRVEWPFPSPRGAWMIALGLGRLVGQSGFVIGAILLLRGEALSEVGIFDERFFLYAEEVDWQMRAHRAGWQVRHCPDVLATHAGGGTGGDPSWRVTMFHASGERFVRKWYGDRGWASFRTAVIVREAIRSLMPGPEARREARFRLRIYLRGPVRSSAALAATPDPS